MNVIIFGNGIVGRATGLILERAGLTPRYWDVIEDRRTCVWGDVVGADVIFLCLSRMISVQDDSQLIYEEVQRIDNLGYTKQFVLRTTVAPGTADRVCKDFALPRRFAAWPEFLREASWEDDALHPDRVVLGVPRHGPWPAPTEAESPVPLLEEIAAKVFPSAPLFKLTLAQSELAKLVSNAALALRISFWNELAQRFPDNVDKELVAAVAEDHRLGSFGDLFFGQPFAGKCLPKDTMLLAELMPTGVIAGVQEINRRMTKLAEKALAKANKKEAGDA